MIFNELKQHGTDDFPIELYCIDEDHPKYEMVFHWHTSLEIIRVLSGELCVTLNKTEFTMRSGDVIFVNSETLHGALPHNCNYECIVFDPDILGAPAHECRDFIDSLTSSKYYVNEFYPASDKDICAAFNNVFEAMRTDGDGSRFFIISMLYRLFGLIISGGYYSDEYPTYPVQDEKNVQKIKKSLAYIRKNYASQLTLDEMARAVDISPKYFCRLFRTMTHKRPTEYLNTYRVERAARALLNTDKSVTDIAYGCGFNDLSYFIKTFKNIKGVSPRAFRNR